VEVTWPGPGTVERFSGVEMGGAYRLRQGEGVARREELPRVALRTEMPAGTHHAMGDMGHEK
jgi:hypothetical protein